MERPRVKQGWRRDGVRQTALRALTALLVALAVAPNLMAVAVAEIPPSGFAAVIPTLRDDVAAAAGPMSRYQIVAELDPATATISGLQRVEFVNETGTSQAEVWFRLFPNAAYYGPGALTVSTVRAAPPGGRMEPVAWNTAVDGTALTVEPDAPVAAGDRIEIELAFVTVVPSDSSGSFGIFNRDTGGGTWVLADWYPGLAGWEPGAGWRLDPPTSFGDPTFAESALYDVTLTTPSDLRVVASGSQIGEGRTSGGETTRRYAAGPARDFTWVADADYVAERATVGDTVVTSYANPAAAASSAAALAVATAALTAYAERYGAYPFAELDLVQAPLAGALGVAWAGILFLDGAGLGGGMANEDPDRLALVVAHEIGHLWWGGSVGANTNDHPFLTEGLTNYLATVYAEDTAGAAAGAIWRERFLAASYRAILAEGADAVADEPIREGQDPRIRGAVHYGKAALGFHAIRTEIGDAAFFGALSALATEYAYQIAEPEDLLAAFETTAGRNLDELWRFWFLGADATEQDIDRVLAGG